MKLINSYVNARGVKTVCDVECIIAVVINYNG